MQRGGSRGVLRCDKHRVGSDQSFECRAIPRTNGSDDRRDFGIDRRRRSLGFDLRPEVRTLVDPRTKNADVVIRQRAGGRHLQPAITVHQTLDEFAVGAVP
jgi:hypothetical protein